MRDGRIVIGLGTGRSGTGSLARLLNAQPDSLCFHEMNPACVRFAGTPRPILNGVEEFARILTHGDPSRVTVDLTRQSGIWTYDRLRQMTAVRLIGDVASYYLSYVRAIAERHPTVRFLCMRRDVAETVRSWMEKTRIKRWRSLYVADRLSSLITRRPFYRSENFWMEHAGTEWRHSPLWDKLFPKFEASTKEDAIRQFCAYYYAEADRLEAELEGRLRFVDLSRFNDPDYQAEVLSFVGIPAAEQVRMPVHVRSR